MKKIYNSPAMLTVQLGTMHMMAESTLSINSDPANSITGQDQILTKESVSDVNLWDNEW